MNDIKRIGGLYDKENEVHGRGSIYDSSGLAPTLMINGGGYSQPMIIEPKLVGGVGEMDSNNNTQYKQQNRIYDSEGLAISECTSPSFNPWYTEGGDENQHIRIRKLTPRECWRLMGFTDEDFDKASKVCSDSRLYSQAGNSIVVDVLEAIFNQMKG